MMAAYLLFDVGGTSIKAAVALSGEGLLSGSGRSLAVPAEGSREDILAAFQEALHQAWQAAADAGATALVGLGYAIGGPFDYPRGISLIRGLTKYEALYGVSLKQEALGWAAPLPKAPRFSVIFQNDAAMFALGEARYGLARGRDRAMFVTLGTGAGSSFTVGGQLVREGPEVPRAGFLYDAPFQDSIIDDYLSRRGLLRMAGERGLPLHGDVKGLAEAALAGEATARQLFSDFGRLTAQALSPWVARFRPDILVIGGRIALSQALFAPALQAGLPGLAIAFSSDTSGAACLGLLACLAEENRG